MRSLCGYKAAITDTELSRGGLPHRQADGTPCQFSLLVAQVKNGGRAYCSDPYEIKLVQGHVELAVHNIINLCKGDMPASFPSCSLLGS